MVALKELALNGPSNYWGQPPTPRNRNSNSNLFITASTPTTAGSNHGEHSPSLVTAADSSVKVRSDKGQPKMSSQRKRVERGRGGGNGQEGNAEQLIWDGCQESIRKLIELVRRCEECKLEIFEMEAEITGRKPAGGKSIECAQGY